MAARQKPSPRSKPARAHISATGAKSLGRHVLTRSEFVSVGTPEETVLQTYFVMLSKMNFDKARDHCDREREIKSVSGGGTNWCDFMATLSRLAHAESVYFSLSFMEKSWSDSWRRKKEPPKAVYENILQELTRVYGVYVRMEGGTDVAWERKMADLTSSTFDYLQARKAMMDLYPPRQLSLPFVCIKTPKIRTPH
jgi:hypothetical protein